MLPYYIRLAFRSVWNFRKYTLTNILGLTLSLICSIIIFRYVYGEMTVDHFNKKLDRIYLTTKELADKPGEIRYSGVNNPNREKAFRDLSKDAGVALRSEFMMFDDGEIEWNNQKYNALTIAADSNFLKILDYPVVLGEADLSKPKSALITEKLAKKIAGKENPIGKTFRYSNGEILTITGIIGQASSKSILSFDLLISSHLTEYWSRMPQTFILLHPNIDYNSINKSYSDFFEMSSWKQVQRFQLYPLKNVYFDSSKSSHTFFNHGNYGHVKTLLIVGLLILFIGIINFVNIYTIVTMKRSRELGLKKVFGIEKIQLFAQLWIENVLMIGFSVLMAIFVSQLINPLVINYLHLNQVPDIRIDLFLGSIFILLLPLLIVLFPFIKYSRSEPIHSFKETDVKQGSFGLNRLFLIFQYIITLSLIMISLFFAKQLYFMLNADPGYRTKDIIKVQFTRSDTDYQIKSEKEYLENKEKREHILNKIEQEMDASTLFSHWTFAGSPNQISPQSNFRIGTNGQEMRPVTLIGVDEAWLKIFGIQLKSGRLWNNDIDGGHFDYKFIVSESALNLFNIKDFSAALLQPEERIWWNSSRSEEMKTNPPYKIVGVVNDFTFAHFANQTNPIVFYYAGKSSSDPLVAAIVPGQKQEAIHFLHQLHDETVNGEFSYSFVEDEVKALYGEDKKIVVVYAVFTGIAIFISMLGLFNISLFDIRKRRKEIAIRKVNGASSSVIMGLILKKYGYLLAVSFIIAVPISLFVVNRYLEGFAHKTPITWWLFAVSLSVTTIISLLTLYQQTIQAANQNPAEVVKGE